MPSPGDQLRAEIAVRLRADGLGEADKLTQELKRANAETESIRAAFHRCETTAEEFRKALSANRADIKGLSDELARILAPLDALEASATRAGAAVEKAAMAQVAAAQKATLAVEKSSVEINAALDKEAAAAEAAAARAAAARAKANAQHEAEMERLHQAHAKFLAQSDAAEEAAAARVAAVRAKAEAQAEAEDERRYRAHLAMLAAAEVAEERAAGAQVASQVAAQAKLLSYSNAWTQAKLEGSRAAQQQNESEAADLLRIQQRLGEMERRTATEAAEAAALRGRSTREAVEQLNLLESEEKLMAGLVSDEAQAVRDLAGLRAHLAQMEAKDSREKQEQLAFVARAQAALTENERERLAEEQMAGSARVGIIEKTVAATLEAGAEVNALLAKEAAATEATVQRETQAREKADSQHEAEMQRAYQVHMEMLDRELAADLAAIEALQRQREQAVQREANRQRSRDANYKEGSFAADAKQQVLALQQIAAQEQSNVQLYLELNAQMEALRAKGSASTNDDFDRIDRLKSQMVSLLGVIDAGGTATQKAASSQATYNQYINAGATYHNRNATEARKHGSALEYVSGLVQRMAGRTGDLGHGMDQARGSSEKLGYSILHVAHAIQDAQYGVGAVLNNIPLVVQAFGGGAGLAGGIMIAAVAFDTLYNNWGKVEKFFGTHGSGVLTPVIDSSKHLAHELSEASSQLEKMSNSTRLSLPQLEKFKELQQKISDIEAEQSERRQMEEFRKIESEAHTETGAAFKKAVGQAGGAEQAERDLIQALVNVGDQTGQNYTIEGITKQADQLLIDAQKGNQEAIDKIRKVIEDFLPSRDRGLADAIERTDPRKAEEKVWAHKIAVAEAAAEKAEKQEADQKKADFDRQAKADEQTPEFKEAQEAAKRKGLIDKFGRAFGQEGFDETSAAEVQRKALDIKAAPKAGKLAPLPDENAAKREDARRRKESVAQELLQQGNGMIDRTQADRGADEFMRLVGSGTNNQRAQIQVFAHMNEFARQNLEMQAQMTGVTQEMAAMFRQLLQESQWLQAQLSMTQGRMRNMRTQRPMPMTTVPPG